MTTNHPVQYNELIAWLKTQPDDFLCNSWHCPLKQFLMDTKNLEDKDITISQHAMFFYNENIGRNIRTKHPKWIMQLVNAIDKHNKALIDANYNSVKLTYHMISGWKLITANSVLAMLQTIKPES